MAAESASNVTSDVAMTNKQKIIPASATARYRFPVGNAESAAP